MAGFVSAGDFLGKTVVGEGLGEVGLVGTGRHKGLAADFGFAGADFQLEAIAGTKQMDGAALLEYYQPLTTWLTEQTKGQKCGW